MTDQAEAVAELLRKIESIVTANRDYYDCVAQREKRAFLTRLYWTRAFLYTGAALLVLTGLRVDRILIGSGDGVTIRAVQFADNAGLVVGGLSIVLLTVGGLMLAEAGHRGCLRAWLRYGQTGETLRWLVHEVSFQQQLLTMRGQSHLPKALAEAERIFRSARDIVAVETRQWALDAGSDFGELMRSLHEIRTHMRQHSIKAVDGTSADPGPGIG
jgi:hypothetical protein